MAYQRQGWASLSPAYRRRLVRAGITVRTYGAGKPLKVARGHNPTRRGRTYASLSPAYKKRLAAQGITSRNYSTTKRLEAARGHEWRVQPYLYKEFTYGDSGYTFTRYADLIRFVGEHLKGHRRVMSLIQLGSDTDIFGTDLKAVSEFHWGAISNYYPLGELYSDIKTHPLRAMVPPRTRDRLDEVEYYTLRTQFRID